MTWNAVSGVDFDRPFQEFVFNGIVRGLGGQSPKPGRRRRMTDGFVRAIGLLRVLVSVSNVSTRCAMKTIVVRLWRDESGFVVSSELIFIMTIVVIGLLTGLVTVRDQVITELADVADAVSEVDQSYSFAAITASVGSVAGSTFADAADFCEQTGVGADQNGDAGTQCLVVVAPSGGEGT